MTVSQRAVHRVADAALRVPLLAKLLGANALIAAAAMVIHSLGVDASQPWLITSTLIASFLLNAALVRLALRPVDAVTRVATAIANGDRLARAEVLATADRRVAGLADAVNSLLDRAAIDEARIRHLTRECLRSRETERANLAQHLRDAMAQDLYALSLQLSAVAELNHDPALASTLESARSAAGDVTGEVRSLADSIYPGVVGNYGLAPAIEALARRLEKRTGIRTTIHANACDTPIPHALQVALYSVAEEAIRNVERHSLARSVVLTQVCSDHAVELSIEDDGAGFDPRVAGNGFSGIGIFRARELLAHAGGELRVSSAPGEGTRVIATARLSANPRAAAG